MGFFQRYGAINPLPISVAKRGPGSNFDFSVISDGGERIVVDVMAGGREEAWPSKRKLAERFTELGVTTNTSSVEVKGSVFVGRALKPGAAPGDQRFV